ncbi:MAG: DUF1858 domain-containing protein [Candidatus Zhuqueibacterota bacterium]
MEKVTKKVTIEELIVEHPFSVNYLMEKNIRCIRCGEPIWGTLEEAAREKGYTDDQIELIVNDMNETISKQ